MPESRRSFPRTAAIATCVFVCLIVAFDTMPSGAQAPGVKALVGGTLIDGYGSKPIFNSVILVEDERIKAIGQVGTIRFRKAQKLSLPKACQSCQACGTCMCT
jgi:hypothetical protein